MCDREIGYDNIKTWLNILQRDNALLTKEVNKRKTPLHLAAEFGSVPVAEALVKQHPFKLPK